MLKNPAFSVKGNQIRPGQYVAADWTAWWWGRAPQPDYIMEVRDGKLAQGMTGNGRQLDGGLYQVVQFQGTATAVTVSVTYTMFTSASSNLWVRVGLDPTAKKDVSAVSVKWGSWATAPYDRKSTLTEVFPNLSTDRVTLFLQATTHSKAATNAVYWHNVALTPLTPQAPKPPEPPPVPEDPWSAKYREAVTEFLATVDAATLAWARVEALLAEPNGDAETLRRMTNWLLDYNRGRK